MPRRRHHHRPQQDSKDSEKPFTTTVTMPQHAQQTVPSTQCLYWHKRHMPMGQSTQIFPCYVVSSPSPSKSYNKRHGINRNLDDDSSSFSSSSSDQDDREEVTVEYLSHYEKFRTRQSVIPMRLVPFHGRHLSDYEDEDDLGRLGWCEVLMEKYLKQKQQQRPSASFDATLEKRYLENVWKMARKCQAANEEEKMKNNDHDGYGNGSDDEYSHAIMEHEHDDVLEEPYTQALSTRDKKKNKTKKKKNGGSNRNNDTDDDDDDDDSSVGFHKQLQYQLSATQKARQPSGEPIRPGDVIEYYSPMFVFGSKQGKRTATVLSVNPQQNMVLKLSNHEYLPKDTRIKRIRTLVTMNQTERILVDHPGVFRRIDQFQLKRQLKLPVGYKVETETDRVKSVMEKNMKGFQKKVMKDLGFVPMEFMHRYGSGSSGGGGVGDGAAGGGTGSSSMGGNTTRIKLNQTKTTTKRSMHHHKSNNNSSFSSSSSLSLSSSHSSDSEDDVILDKLRSTPKKQKKNTIVDENAGASFSNQQMNHDKDHDTDDEKFKEESKQCAIDTEILLQKEKELESMGLSDDEIPPSIFPRMRRSISSSSSCTSTSDKSKSHTTIPNGTKTDNHENRIIRLNKYQHDNHDDDHDDHNHDHRNDDDDDDVDSNPSSDDSMNFHASLSLSPEEHQGPKSSSIISRHAMSSHKNSNHSNKHRNGNDDHGNQNDNHHQLSYCVDSGSDSDSDCNGNSNSSSDSVQVYHDGKKKWEYNNTAACTNRIYIKEATTLPSKNLSPKEGNLSKASLSISFRKYN